MVFAVGTLNVAIRKIFKNDDKDNALFYFLLWVALSGSFVQMQMSFPYQLAIPAMLLGFYIGFIAKRSEKFIQPIKLLNLKTKKILHQINKTFWLIMIIVISVIYMDWINTYSTLNYLNKKQKIHLLKQATPRFFHHLELQKILGVFGTTYYKIAEPYKSIAIEKLILSYWPHDNTSLNRYMHILMKNKRYDEALKVIKTFKKVSYRGLYSAHFNELQLYLNTKQTEKYKQAFVELLNQDDSALSLNKNTYAALLQYSLHNKDLYKYTEQIYQKHSKNNRYNCLVENSMVLYYNFKKQYKKAKQHIDIINKSSDSKCLDSALSTSVLKSLKAQKP
ncbi:MAG: hypothetical protein FXV79_04305 [Candidatus Thioglobus sp.]|nr:MAG: hypothetical protein FXV79_04305 [Candidatus Thioglobus sp.]